jgi:hypothetical protein
MDNVMRLHFGAKDIPENVKLNALLFLHNFCTVNSAKVVAQLKEAGQNDMAAVSLHFIPISNLTKEFTKLMESMPEPLSLQK